MLIADMFSGELRPPVLSDQPPSATTGFEAFWAAWPSGPRKVAKKQCFEKWIRKALANHAEHIRLHVEWMKAQDEWQKGNGSFICAPLVYLNQARWSEWVPCDLPTRPLIDPALTKIAADRAAAVSMPASVREKLAQIRSMT